METQAIAQSVPPRRKPNRAWRLYVALPVTPAQHVGMKIAARAEGRTVANWLRELVVKELRRRK